MSSGQPKPVAHIIYKPSGRPTMERKRDVDEPGNPYKVFRANKPVRCRRCQKEGHNARGCKANVTSETPWERRQRLQKGKSVSFYKFFLFKSKMPITNTVKKHAYIWLQGNGRPSARRQGFQAPSSSQTQSSAQPPPTHQPYTMTSSSSNQVAGSQPQTPAPQPQVIWSQPPTPWSQN